MVCVRPGKFPANVIVAPNSPSARAQHSTAPAISEGRTRGKVTLHRTVHRLAPRVRAASSNRMSIERSPASTVITRNGIATKVSARMAPAVVKGRWTPNVVASQPPSSPRRPKASSSATPPTTGGRTIGKTVKARKTDRPGKVSLANVQASGTPRMSAIAVAENEAKRERRSAVRTSGDRSSSHATVQGTRRRRPSSGTMKNAAPTPASTRSGIGAAGRTRAALRAGKAIPSQRFLSIAEEIADKRPGQRDVLGILEDRDRIVGKDVGRGWNRDPLHRVAGRLDVSDVNDAGVRFTERDFADHGFDIRLQAGGFHGHAGFLQGLGGVASTGN